MALINVQYIVYTWFYSLYVLKRNNTNKECGNVHKHSFTTISNIKINRLRKINDVENQAPKQVFIHKIHTLETERGQNDRLYTNHRHSPSPYPPGYPHHLQPGIAPDPRRCAIGRTSDDWKPVPGRNKDVFRPRPETFPHRGALLLVDWCGNGVYAICNIMPELELRAAWVVERMWITNNLSTMFRRVIPVWQALLDGGRARTANS